MLGRLVLVACAPVAAVSNMITLEPLAAYPGYTGNLVVGGRITVETTGMGAAAAQVVTFSLRGVDPACGTENVTGVANACGIHIHEGTTCAQAGGHYWNKAALGSDSSNDPWQTTMYDVSSSSVAMDTITVTTGASYSDVLGRVIVVHDVSGGRVACAAMRASVSSGTALAVTSMSAYPGYTGNLNVMGTATISTTGSGASSTQEITYEFTGGDRNCGTTDVTGVANACGIHLHEGGNCLSAGAIGGHYWNKAAITNDPWALVMYNLSAGTAVVTGTAGGTVRVVTGLSAGQVDGSLLVIHDVTGARIACSVLAPAATNNNNFHLETMSAAMGRGVFSGAALLVLVSLLRAQ